MDEPTTEAGRLLLKRADVRGYGHPVTAKDILAIEVEARADCEIRNERLQQSLDLYRQSDSVTMTTAYFDEQISDARATVDEGVLARVLDDYWLQRYGELTVDMVARNNEAASELARRYAAIMREAK